MNRLGKALLIPPGLLGVAAVLACAHPGHAPAAHSTPSAVHTEIHPPLPTGRHKDFSEYIHPTTPGSAHSWPTSSSTTGQASPPVVGSTKATPTGYGSQTGHTKTPCPPTPPASTTTGSTPTATVGPPTSTSPSVPTSTTATRPVVTASTTAARTSGGIGVPTSVRSSGLANTGPKAEQLAGIGGGLLGLGLVATFFGVRWSRRARRGH